MKIDILNFRKTKMKKKSFDFFIYFLINWLFLLLKCTIIACYISNDEEIYDVDEIQWIQNKNEKSIFLN